MKDSGVAWIGQVPEGWDVGRVKDYYKFTTGFTPPSERDDLYPEDGEVWITIEDMKSPVVTESAKHIDKEYAAREGKGKVSKGSLLYSFKLSIGTTAIAGADLYTNEAIASFIPSDNVSIDFLKYSCISIEHNANRNIYDAKILNQRLINNAKIAFPPLAEQKRIAKFLDEKCGKIDELSEKVKAQIEKLEAYKKSLITEAVTPKDGWEVKRLKYVCTCLDGRRIPVDSSLRTEGPYPYWGAGSIQGYIDEYIFDEEIVLLGEDGAPFFDPYRPVAHYCNEKVWVNNHIHVLRANKGMTNAKFLVYALNSVDYTNYISGAILNKLTQAKMKNIRLPCPPLSIQEEVVAYLDRKCGKVDEIIKQRKAQLEKLAEYKKSLIYEYVTGKKEVAA